LFPAPPIQINKGKNEEVDLREREAFIYRSSSKTYYGGIAGSYG
jgi:hypothetical protein